MTENQIVGQLRGIAFKLTSDFELQKDLMQEMFVHLVQVQTAQAGQTLSWYLKSCEFHARNYLKLGRSIDSLKRMRNGVSLDEPLVNDAESSDHNGNGTSHIPVSTPVEIQGELITNDIVNLILPQLSLMQQQVLFLLMKGCGVREAARELGVTHPAVIKHRKKIARIAREFLQEAEGVGVAIAVHSGNGNGHSNSEAHAA